MERPLKYIIICNKTGQMEFSGILPSICYLETMEPAEQPNVFQRRQTKTVYIDTRYEAKLRLYNYITYTKKGLPIPCYNPFKGTDIGINTPILNF